MKSAISSLPALRDRVMTRPKPTNNGGDSATLILLCRAHHTVVHADLELYTVARLSKVKADYERSKTVVPDQQASDRALLIDDNSVRNHDQSGGLTPQTMNAGTIKFAGSASGPCFL